MDKKDKLSRREIAFICIILLLISIIIVSLFTASQNGVALFRIYFENIFTFFVSVVCSILATVLLRQDSPSTEDLTIDKIAAEVDNRVRTLYLQQSMVNATATYVDTNDPNRDFNAQLNKSMSSTQNYIYFSDRALYLPFRLSKDLHSTSDKLTLTILLADFRDNSLFSARSDIYMQQERAKHISNHKNVRPIEEIIRQSRIDVIKSIYALGQLRNQYNINVYLHKEIPFIRFEITDTLLVLSFLTQLSTGRKYPPTVLYENENIFKPNFEDYSYEVMKRSYKLEPQDYAIESLLKMAEESGIINVSKEVVTKYYDEQVKNNV